MRILFSPKPEWENNLRAGFRKTRHDITFGELSTAGIANHDLVVPLTISALRELCGLRELLGDHPLPIPSLECVDHCDDKYQFNTLMVEKGFGAHIPQMGRDLAYPYVLKKRIDEWGRSCHVIRSESDENEHAALLRDPDFFAQEFVAGTTEYTTHILYRQGRIVRAINIEYQFGTRTPVKGKDVHEFMRPCPCRHLDLFASVLDSIGFEGLCCVNYKLLGRRPMILEINPRFGGSLAAFFFSFIRHVS